MRVSFDGMRRNATRDMNTLYRAVKEVAEIFCGEYEMKRLIDAFNEAALSVDVFNCLEDNENGEFKALDIEIERFEDE